MDKERFLSSGLLEQYVLGLTTAEESREVERYLQQFPELQAEVNSMRQAIEQYAIQHSIPPAPQNESLNGLPQKPTNVAAEIPSWPGHDPLLLKESRRLSRRTVVASTAAALLFGLMAYVLYQQEQKADYAFQHLTAEFALYRQECEQERDRLQDQARLYASFIGPDTRQLVLHGTDLAPQANALVFWNEQKHSACLRILHLPPPPPQKQYQIWADVDGRMINAGLLNNDSSVLQNISFIENASSLNITLEPKGGSKEPTVSQLVVNGKV